MKDLLKSLTALSEGEKTTTKTGTVHKGEYGNKYGKEDVRDQYGHKVGRKDKGEEAKKEAPKKGRGRPKKDTGETGAKFDSSELNNVFGGKKPKKEIGKVSKKHSLKEYMESVEDTKHAEAIMEGMFGDTVDHTSVAANLGKLAKVIKSVQTPEQFAVAQKYAQRMSGTIMKHQHDNMGFGSGLKSNLQVMRAISADLKAKAEELGVPYDPLAEAGEALTVKPIPGASQISDPEGNPIGTADAATANMIKQAASQGKLNLDAGQGVQEGKKAKPDFLDVDKDGNKKETFKKAVKDKKKVDESITLEESPQTLQHIVNRFKNEVKRFVNGDELDNDLYEALYDYYLDTGEMPYGTAKGRTGDPYEWVTQRFDQDVQQHVQQPSLPLGRPAVEEGDINPRDSSSIQMHRQHALAEPTQNFRTHGQKPGSMAAPRGSRTEINRPAPEPTPWGTDPIAAATDRAFNFVSSLKNGTKFTKEGTEMKDIQFEGWEKQLNNLLSEGITVSSSQGQQGQPNTVTVSATENDADSLLQVLRSAGIGGFGAGEEKPEIGYGVAQGGEEEPTGTGTEPQPAPDVVGDDGDMLSMLKKMAGLDGGDTEVVAIGSDEDEGQDYEDEEGADQTLEPADDGEEEGSEEEQGSEESDEEGDEEEVTDEGNAFTGKLKQTPQGGEFKMGDKSYKDTSSIEEGEHTCNECGMLESECGCDHEQVEENFANSAKDPADVEFAKLKALLSMGGDLHKMKTSQAMGNPIKMAEATQAINDWKKLSGIK